jgi:hypothetical protein
MTVHLVKMAVGIEDLDHLRDVQAHRFAEAERIDGTGRLRHLTRNTPRRSTEVLDGGSIYWVMKGYIRARQTIIGIEEATGRRGRKRCALILSPDLARTVLTPHKPIQGWRYMEDAAAPEDLGDDEIDPRDASLPPNLAAELRTLGLL